MANYIIDWYNNSGAKTYTYIAQGMMTTEDRKTQSISQITLPKLPETSTLLNSLFGQKRQMAFSFILIQRSDDYTNGTGTTGYPGDGGPEIQKQWLLNGIFAATGYNQMTDETGRGYVGKISEMTITRSGDDPLIYNVQMVFMMGYSPV